MQNVLTIGKKIVTIDASKGYIIGLTNTNWDVNPVSGRAATEDQLQALAADIAVQKVDVVAGDNMNITSDPKGAKIN